MRYDAEGEPKMTYTAGIIGTGGIAGMGILGMHDADEIGRVKSQASHAGGYEVAEEIELIAAADIDGEKLDRFGELWSVDPPNRFNDHVRMCRALNLDVVSVCTPSLYHHQHVLDIASLDDPPGVILCEKPIATSVKDAEEMVAACQEAEIELVINHSFRFTEKLRCLKTLLNEEGLIGEILSVSAQFRMELLRNSTHLLDTLLYLLDARASFVSGFITEENEAVDSLNAGRTVTDSGGGGHLVTEDGTFVTIDCTVPREYSSMLYHIIGTEGRFYLNNDDGEWRYWSLDGGTHNERKLPGIEGSWTWEEDYREAFANAVDHVVELLNETGTNRSSGKMATKSLEIIVAFYISHYTGGRVSIPLDVPLRNVEITSW